MIRARLIYAHSAAKALLNAGLVAALWFAAGPAVAHEAEHAGHAEIARPTEDKATADVEIADLELVDRDGRPRLFRSDVISDRIVAITFIYTTCTTVCPVVSAIFGQVAQRLGERLGEEVFLISLSVDPVTDRPARLRAYAQRYSADAGWIWLTGNKLSMDKVLEGLGAYTPNYEDHPAMVLVGDGRTGQWTRFFGFPSPDKIVAKVDALASARPATASAAVNQ